MKLLIYFFFERIDLIKLHLRSHSFLLVELSNYINQCSTHYNYVLLVYLSVPNTILPKFHQFFSKKILKQALLSYITINKPKPSISFIFLIQYIVLMLTVRS